jgi:hypothetical protein
MKLTLLIISTAALALATPIIPTMVYDLPSVATSTDDLLPNIMMPTIVKTLPLFATSTDDPFPDFLHDLPTIVKDPPPLGTPTEEPLPTDLGEWLQPFYPNPCKEDPDRYFRFCAGVAALEAWKEKVEM